MDNNNKPNNNSSDNLNKKNDFKDINTWEDIEIIDSKILRGVYAYGFENPSPIQQKALLPMFSGKDLIAQAQSGTGKTGVFSIGALQHVDSTKNCTQVIVISPTRELSNQSESVIKSLSLYRKDIIIQQFVGGTSVSRDIEKISTSTPHIAVGCPGRIYDMLRRGAIRGETVSLFILDEADEILSTGFRDQIHSIFQLINREAQICLFSATMPSHLKQLTCSFMRDPIEILVKASMLTLEGIKQYYIAVDSDQCKYITLKDLYETITLSQCIIYCNSVRRVKELYSAMILDKFPVDALHSELEQSEREEIMKKFKSGKSRVLISTNITARGIDVQQVSTVINFDLPKCVHNYLHRIGRSGRWGRKGVGINMVTPRDMLNLKDIESHYNTQIEELPASFVAN